MLKALSRVFKMLTQVNPTLVQDVDTIINAIGGMENWWKPVLARQDYA